MCAEPSPVDFPSSGQPDPHTPAVYPICSPPSDAAQLAIVPASEEEAEVLHASIKAGSVAQIVVAMIAVVGLIYLLKLVMVITLSATLLAFVLEPLVSGLNRLRVPRPAGALLAVVLTLSLAGAFSYFFYQHAVDFATDLPKYSGKIRTTLAKMKTETKKIEDTTRSVIAAPKDGPKAVPVEVQESPALSRVVSKGTEVLLAIGFAPFLVFFMLTWKDHARDATVRLFAPEHRAKAHRTVGKISSMIRSFVVANAVVGLVNAAVSSLVFWWLGIPFFYFIGVISGFVSLVPYLGVFLALLPPLTGVVGGLNTTSVVLIFVTVVGLHVLTMNVLYPKIVGKRLRLNPLAVTLALLFWAWIWGAMGLILAVPIVGATKIICDYVDSLRGFGAWLGD
ncbi:MAG TPA: AI-2E family transporter [Nitrososphaera sp.]|nr:AI-2E family transporter [Nitrososphaera sp.]